MRLVRNPQPRCSVRHDDVPRRAELTSQNLSNPLGTLLRSIDQQLLRIDFRQPKTPMVPKQLRDHPMLDMQDARLGTEAHLVQPITAPDDNRRLDRQLQQSRGKLGLQILAACP